MAEDEVSEQEAEAAGSPPEVAGSDDAGAPPEGEDPMEGEAPSG